MLKNIQTKSDYEEYTRRVDEFLTINKVRAGCFSRANEESEPHFSWTPCDCCQRKLGGNRETYAFVCEGFKPDFQSDICSDCVYYLEYGELDDTTMMEIENNK